MAQAGKPAATATYAFLFSDIEGSTSRLVDLGYRYADLLADHHRIVREAIGAHGGWELGTEGDAFAVAFRSASAAVAAATDAQVALATHDWPDGRPLRVRMGIHAGEVWQSETGLVGMPLHQTARVMAAARGGQVLVSEATATLLGTSLPDGATLVDLGRHRLKDLGGPQRLYRLEHAGAESNPEPPRTLDARLHNLPVLLTSFVGRQPALAELRRLLGEHRLLTLVGAGGTGKTRLAYQLAGDLVDEHPDGVWLVELAPVASPDLIENAVASVLGVRGTEEAPLEHALQDYVAGKRMLLLLDNCEHAVDAVAKLADRLLRDSAGLRVLATSREAFGITGEVAWPVPPLDVDASPEGEGTSEAVGLFLDRAALAAPGFAPSAEELDLVADICRRVDGLPLAIELAASRVRALSVAQVAERLEDRFRLLRAGDRTAAPRQRTLQALVDWSHDLLIEPERVLFRRLSAFAGGFTLDAVEAIAAGPPLDVADAVDLLTQVVEKSLVVHDAPAERYRMLQTIDDYAGAKLEEAGEAVAIQGRHAEFYAGLAVRSGRGLLGPESLAWLDRLEAEIDNLRAAFAWLTSPTGPPDGRLAMRMATELAMYWASRGSEGEAAAWYRQALDKAPDAPSPERARALARLAMCDWARRGTPAAADLLEEALVMARAVDDDAALCAALYGRTRPVPSPGDLGEMLAAARRSGLPDMEVFALLGQAVVATTKHDDVGPPLDAAVERARATGSELLLAKALMGASMIRSMRDPGRAVELTVEAESSAARIGDRRALATLAEMAGKASHQKGDFDAARAKLEEARDLWRLIGDRARTAAMEAELGQIEADAGGDPRARLAAAEARVADARAEGPLPYGAASFELGVLALTLGELPRARVAFAQSVDAWREMSGGMALPAAVATLGDVHVLEGDLDAAEARFRNVLQLVQTLPGGEEVMPLAAMGLGDVARERGDFATARLVRLKVLEIWEANGLPSGDDDLFMPVAMDAATLGHWEDAAVLLGAARRVQEESGLPALLGRSNAERIRARFAGVPEDAVAAAEARGAAMGKDELRQVLRRVLDADASAS